MMSDRITIRHIIRDKHTHFVSDASPAGISVSLYSVSHSFSKLYSNPNASPITQTTRTLTLDKKVRRGRFGTARKQRRSDKPVSSCRVKEKQVFDT